MSLDETNHSTKHAADAPLTNQFGAEPTNINREGIAFRVLSGPQLQNKAAMIRITEALTGPAISQVRSLFREYSTLNGVEVCLQDFEAEVTSLPGFYGRPAGRLLLALHDGPAGDDAPIGCVGLRKLEEGICEMKRLYVRPGFRKEGAGCALVEHLIAEARAMDYKKMRLDTLPIMREAQALYRNLGFVEIPPYIKNRIADALYFELGLR